MRQHTVQILHPEHNASFGRNRDDAVHPLQQVFCSQSNTTAMAVFSVLLQLGLLLAVGGSAERD